MALRDEAYLSSAWQAGQVGLGEAGGGVGECMQASATPWPLRDGLWLALCGGIWRGGNKYTHSIPRRTAGPADPTSCLVLSGLPRQAVTSQQTKMEAILMPPPAHSAPRTAPRRTAPDAATSTDASQGSGRGAGDAGLRRGGGDEGLLSRHLPRKCALTHHHQPPPRPHLRRPLPLPTPDSRNIQV